MCHHHDWALDALREETREEDPEDVEPESELEKEHHEPERERAVAPATDD